MYPIKVQIIGFGNLLALKKFYCTVHIMKKNPRMHWTMFFRSYISSILKKHQCTTSLCLDLKKLNNKSNKILRINNQKASKVITFIVSKTILVKTFCIYVLLDAFIASDIQWLQFTRHFLPHKWKYRKQEE